MGLGGGFFYVVFGLYYSVWKSYIRDKPLSQTEFIRACILMGASTFIMALGIVILFSIPLWQNPEPEAIIPTILVNLVCLIGFPTLGVGMFVLQRKMDELSKRPRK